MSSKYIREFELLGVSKGRCLAAIKIHILKHFTIELEAKPSPKTITNNNNTKFSHKTNGKKTTHLHVHWNRQTDNVKVESFEWICNIIDLHASGFRTLFLLLFHRNCINKTTKRKTKQRITQTHLNMNSKSQRERPQMEGRRRKRRIPWIDKRRPLKMKKKKTTTTSERLTTTGNNMLILCVSKRNYIIGPVEFWLRLIQLAIQSPHMNAATHKTLAIVYFLEYVCLCVVAFGAYNLYDSLWIVFCFSQCLDLLWRRRRRVTLHFPIITSLISFLNQNFCCFLFTQNVSFNKTDGIFSAQMKMLYFLRVKVLNCFGNILLGLAAMALNRCNKNPLKCIFFREICVVSERWRERIVYVDSCHMSLPIHQMHIDIFPSILAHSNHNNTIDRIGTQIAL